MAVFKALPTINYVTAQQQTVVVAVGQMFDHDPDDNDREELDMKDAIEEKESEIKCNTDYNPGQATTVVRYSSGEKEVLLRLMSLSFRMKGMSCISVWLPT